MSIRVLAQTDTWAVVAKPPGMAVHRSKMVNERDTVMRAVRRQFDGPVAPVHRLDRPTSGCLLLTLDPSATPILQAALAAGTKQYLALVRGHRPDPSEVCVDRPMKDSAGVLRNAETWIRPVGTSADPRCSLLLARPSTGRFHQVRRHCRDLDHPVLGDSKHGDTKINRWWREHYGLPRLGLHCLSLQLAPEGLPPIDVTCPVPFDLLTVFEQLPWFDDAVAAVPHLRPPPRGPASDPHATEAR